MNKFYVYFHINSVTNKVFYIGKGTKRRAYQKGNKRSKFWQNTVKKYGYYIDIIESELSEEVALEREMFYISKIGLKNLVNLTDGGQGNSGYICSEETRRKIGEKSKGRKHSEETKKLLSKQSTGRFHSEESKKLMSEKQKGKKMSEESKLKMSESSKGKKLSETTIQKMIESRSGSKSKVAKKIINIETKEIYNSITEAANSIGISMKLLSRYLSGNRKNKTPLEYYKEF